MLEGGGEQRRTGRRSRQEDLEGAWLDQEESNKADLWGIVLRGLAVSSQRVDMH